MVLARRSAALAVQQGLVEEVLIWALDASRGQAGSSKRPRHLAVRQGVLEIVMTGLSCSRSLFEVMLGSAVAVPASVLFVMPLVVP